MFRLNHIAILVLLSSLSHAQNQPVSDQVQDGSAPDRAAAISRENRDPLLDLPSLPRNKVTLLGGLITNTDPVMNRITVRPYGGKQKILLNFDIRSAFYLDGKPATQRDLRNGQRVYVDTMLNGSKVFVKSIWIQTNAAVGSGRGQVLSYDPGSGVLILRDELSAKPETFHLTSTTVVRNGSDVRTTADLEAGSLVALTFGAQDGTSGVVREVALLAKPGAEFTFYGKVTFIDLSQKMIALDNDNDSKNYEVYFESLPTTMLQSLREGSQIGIVAVFNGSRYIARRFDVGQVQRP
ncbi:MAG: hypothetical protein NVSMB58_22550 [Terriglobales bacterium]